MRYICITGGVFAENCYVLIDDETKAAAVIDPGCVNDKLLRAIAGLKVENILLTHGHFDHTEGADELSALTGAPVAAYKTEAALAADSALNASNLTFDCSVTCTVTQLLEDGETFNVGSIPVTVMHTPGHTAGGCCYITPEAVFTGDTLMGYSIGRSDLPTASETDLMRSLQKLAKLPGNPDICGGHGPVTKLSDEKRLNPYLQIFN